MTIKLAHITLDPPVFLAPMAGITDLPFRTLVGRFGAGLVVSEMIASKDMINHRASTAKKFKVQAEGTTTAIQLAGCEAYWMAEAAKLCADQGARIIDLNMGCPAKKVTNGYSGSALMRHPDHALSLIDAVLSAVSVPITVKMRLGWDENSLNAAYIAKRAEESGVQMITVHGRTRCQFYKGEANWKAIQEVKAAVSIPIIANGDIESSETAEEALKDSLADGVMVGRAVRGRPWLLKTIAGDLSGEAPFIPPQGQALFELISEHYEMMLSFYGGELGIKMARKHLGWYMDTISVPSELRGRILRSDCSRAVLADLKAAFLSTPSEMAA